MTRSIILGGFELTSTADATAPRSDSEWLAADVPGGVHETLLRHGKIEHPYFDQNEATAHWVEEQVWWYRTSFPGPAITPGAERLRLRCNGLDTVSTIWLNGSELGSHCNQFRPAVFDVTRLIGETNELLLCFRPPFADLDASTTSNLREAGDDQPAIREGTVLVQSSPPTPALIRTRRRKAACSWGWDFGPRLPSIGLHGTVELLHERHAIIQAYHARTLTLDTTTGEATVGVAVEVDMFASPADVVRVELTTPVGQRIAVERRADSLVEVEMAVQDAQAWWTHDLGEQPLYQLRVELYAAAELIDALEGRLGIRTIELDRSADVEEGGCLFRFILNGVPIFAKGANWVPISLLVGSVTNEKCRELVEMARRAEMNMLRVWGGGHYELDAFHDACDETGVLVWMDFMFACDDYPSEDPELAAEVALEAEFQVRRLRNHPSLAMWAGNNEIHAFHQLNHGNLLPGNWGWSFFHELLPQMVSKHSQDTPYWPGSPWGESVDQTVNGPLDGDRHAWEVWHGFDFGADGPRNFATRGEEVHFSRYAEDHGKFISEFGLHAAPELATLQRWTTPGTLDLNSPALAHRNKDTPADKSLALMEFETGAPADLSQYIDFSMACQAEGLKFGIEHYRRRQPHCSGTLIWQFNDVWPGISWSVLDYDRVGKAGYYFVQRAYRPVIASFREAPEGLELWVTNSSSVLVDLRLDVEISTFSGRLEARDTVATQVRPTCSQAVWFAPLHPTADSFAWVSSDSDAIEPNRKFFGRLKDLPLNRSSLVAKVHRQDPMTAVLDLTSDGYSYFAHVVSPRPGVIFGANYLDLRHGDTRRILLTGLPEDYDLSALEIRTYRQPASHPIWSR